MVEPQQQLPRRYPGKLAVGCCGTLLHHNVNVLDTRQQFGRKRSNRLPNKAAKPRPTGTEPLESFIPYIVHPRSSYLRLVPERDANVHRLATDDSSVPVDHSYVRGFFRQQRVSGMVRGLVRRGVGVREASWPLPQPEDDADFVETVRAWMAECGATMRRPNGVDHVALAFSCRDHNGAVRCSVALGVRPLAAYLGPAGERDLRAFLRDARFAVSHGGEVKAVFLSMGDLIAALEEAA